MRARKSQIIENARAAHNKLAMIRFLVKPGGCLVGAAAVPGDKSISHRAIILGALAEGTTRVAGLLEGEDVLHTVSAFQQMGVAIDREGDGRVSIEGVGLSGLSRPTGALQMGNSGTAMRLLAGVMVGQAFDAVLRGDESLESRPMRRIIEPLREMGGQIEGSSSGTAPLRTHPAATLKGIQYRLPVPSAQVKSAILLAGLYARGEVTVIESDPSRDHTERMLRGFGYEVGTRDRAVTLSGGGRLTARDLTVPGDVSSAAFFMVGATIAPGSNCRFLGVGINPTRTGVIEILERMGARIRLTNESVVAGEPVSDIEVEYSDISGIEVPRRLVPLAIDEFPAIAVAAACARGTTVIRGAEELRVKESDRISAIVAGLRGVGVEVEELRDGMVIQGGSISGGRVDSRGDHRIAMAFSVAGLRSADQIIIDDCANVATSFPDFTELSRQLGLRIATTTNGD